MSNRNHFNAEQDTTELTASASYVPGFYNQIRVDKRTIFVGVSCEENLTEWKKIMPQFILTETTNYKILA